MSGKGVTFLVLWAVIGRYWRLCGADDGSGIIQDEYRREHGGYSSHRRALAPTASAFGGGSVFFDEEEGFSFLPGHQEGAVRRLQMDGDSIGSITVRNEQLIRGGSPATNFTRLFPGGLFTIELEDRDSSNDFSASDGVVLEPATIGCASDRETFGSWNGKSIIISHDQTGVLPPDNPSTYTQTSFPAGAVGCVTAGPDQPCVIGSSAAGQSNSIAFRYPGFYSLCVCLSDLAGGCGGGSTAVSVSQYSIDIGFLIQVVGFPVDGITEVSCAVGQYCSMAFTPAGFHFDSNTGSNVVIADGQTAFPVDVTNGIIGSGGKPDMLAVFKATAADSSAFGTACTANGITADMDTTQTGTSRELLARSAMEAGSPVVSFDIVSVHAATDPVFVSITPGAHWLCYCPFATYTGLSCAAATNDTNGNLYIYRDAYPFKAAALTIAGPVKNTVGTKKCAVSRNPCIITLTAGQHHGLQDGDRMAIVGDGTYTNADAGDCGDANDFIGGTLDPNLYPTVDVTTVSVASGGGVEYVISLPPSSPLVQGKYKLCWCPGVERGGAICTDDSTAESYKWRAGDIMVVGAKADVQYAPYICYAGRTCEIKVTTSPEADSFCYGCDAGDEMRMLRRKPADLLDGEVLYYNESCGETDPDKVEVFTDSVATASLDPAGGFLKFTFQSTSKKAVPRYAGYRGENGTSLFHLCWQPALLSQVSMGFNTIDPSFSTTVTGVESTTAIDIYGPFGHNWVHCKANETNLVDSQSSVPQCTVRVRGRRMEKDDLMIYIDGPLPFDLLSENDAVCGTVNRAAQHINGIIKNTADSENATEFDVYSNLDLLVPVGGRTEATEYVSLTPGIYQLCYCPKVVWVGGPAPETQTNTEGCEEDSRFTTPAGYLMVRGPDRNRTVDSNGRYEVLAGHPFQPTLYGWAMGNADNRLKFSDDPGCISNSTEVLLYPANTPVTTLTAVPVLPDTPVELKEGNGTTTPTMQTNLTLEQLEAAGLRNGAFIVFTASQQDVDQETTANFMTNDRRQIFRLESDYEEDEQHLWMYQVVSNAASDGSFKINFIEKFPDLPDGWTPDGHKFRMASVERYPYVVTSNATATLYMCWSADTTSWYKVGQLLVRSPRTFDASPTLHVPALKLSRDSIVPTTDYKDMVFMNVAGPIYVSFQTSSVGTVNTTHNLCNVPGSFANLYGGYQIDKAYSVRLRFPDKSAFKAVPIIPTQWEDYTVYSGTDGADSREFTITDDTPAFEALPDRGSQGECGSIFFELNSNDADGFPMPAKCWHVATYDYVELYLQFSKYNGLKAGASYEFVVKGAFLADPFNQTNATVEIAVLSDPADDQCEIIEQGTAAFDTSSFQINSDGIVPELNDSGALELAPDIAAQKTVECSSSTGKCTFSFILTPSDSGLAADDHVYIFMYPLTMWDVSEGYYATCTPVSGVGTCTHADITFENYFNMNPSRLNVIKMHVVDGAITEPYKYTLHEVQPFRSSIGSFPGFFPLVPFYFAMAVKGGASYLAWGGHGGVNLLSSARLYYPVSVPFASLATYHWDEDSNNDQQFYSVLGATSVNLLHVKVRTGPIMSGAAAGGKPTYFRFELPKWTEGGVTYQYTCQTTNIDAFASSSAASPLFLLARQSTGQALDGPPGFGSINATWVANSGEAANVCLLQLDSGVLVPAGTVLLFRLLVENPYRPLKASHPSNVWTVNTEQLYGFQGVPSSTALVSKTSQSKAFDNDPADNRFTKNVAVVGRIPQTKATIVPVESFAKGDMNRIAVAFKTEQSTGGTTAKSGSVEVRAPTDVGFEFPCDMTLGDVGDAFPDDPQFSLPAIAAVKVPCAESPTGYTHVVNVAFGDGEELKGDQFYGFTVPIINSPQDYSRRGYWDITTFDMACSYEADRAYDCSPIDGILAEANVTLQNDTYAATIRPAIHREFGVMEGPSAAQISSREAILDAVAIDSRPEEWVSGGSTHVLVKWRVPASVANFTTFEIMFPQYYREIGNTIEVPDMSWWAEQPAVKRARFYEYAFSEGSWTIVGSSIDQGVVRRVTLTADHPFEDREAVYYIKFKAITSVPPTDEPTANSWLFIANPADFALPEHRVFGMVRWPAQQVNVLRNLVLEYSSSIAATQNLLTFAIQTSAPVPSGGCLFLSFPAGQGFLGASVGTPSDECQLYPREATPFYTPPEGPLESYVSCVFGRDNNNHITNVTFAVGEDVTELPRGRYRFGFFVTNPTDQGGAAVSDIFTFHSSKTCNTSLLSDMLASPYLDETKEDVLDHPISIKSFDILAPLETVRLLREDTAVMKPGATSTLTIGFQNNRGTSSFGFSPTMSIHAPQGYMFPLGCTSALNLQPFGGSFGEFVDFSGLFRVASCTADPTARHQVTIAFESKEPFNGQSSYGFSIQATNPVRQPDPHHFVFMLEDLAGIVTRGELATFLDSAMVPDNGAQSTPNRLSFYLTPVHDIPGDGGSITFRLPTGYLSHAGGPAGINSGCTGPGITINASLAGDPPAIMEKWVVMNGTDVPGEKLTTLTFTDAGLRREFQFPPNADAICLAEDGYVTFVLNTPGSDIAANTPIMVEFVVTNPSAIVTSPKPFEVWSCKPVVISGIVTDPPGICVLTDLADYAASGSSLDFVSIFGIPIRASFDADFPMRGSVETEGTMVFVAELLITLPDSDVPPQMGDQLSIVPPLGFTPLCSTKGDTLPTVEEALNNATLIDAGMAITPHEELSLGVCTRGDKPTEVTFEVVGAPPSDGSGSAERTLSGNRTLNLTIMGHNPNAPIGLTDNYWQVRYHRELGGDVSQQKTPGWGVRPMILDLQVYLEKEFASATSSRLVAATSTVTVSFTPIQSFDRLDIASRDGFSFGSAVPSFGGLVPTAAGLTLQALSGTAGQPFLVRFIKVSNPTFARPDGTTWAITTRLGLEEADHSANINQGPRSGIFDRMTGFEAANLAADGTTSTESTNLFETLHTVSFKVSSSIKIESDTRVAVVAENGPSAAAITTHPSIIVIPPTAFELQTLERTSVVTNLFPEVALSSGVPIGSEGGRVWALQGPIPARELLQFTVTVVNPAEADIDGTAKWSFFLAMENLTAPDTVVGITGYVVHALGDWPISQYLLATGGLKGEISDLVWSSISSQAVGAEGALWRLALVPNIDAGAPQEYLEVVLTPPTQPPANFSFPGTCSDASQADWQCFGGNTARLRSLVLGASYEGGVAQYITFLVNHPKQPVNESDPAAWWSVSIGTVDRTSLQKTPRMIITNLRPPTLKVMTAQIVYPPESNAEVRVTLIFVPEVVVSAGSIQLFAPAGFEFRGDNLASNDFSRVGANAQLANGELKPIYINNTAEKTIALTLKTPASPPGRPLFGMAVMNADGLVVSANYAIPGSAVVPDSIFKSLDSIRIGSNQLGATHRLYLAIVITELPKTLRDRLSLDIQSPFPLSFPDEETAGGCAAELRPSVLLEDAADDYECSVLQNGDLRVTFLIGDNRIRNDTLTVTLSTMIVNPTQQQAPDLSGQVILQVRWSTGAGGMLMDASFSVRFDDPLIVDTAKGRARPRHTPFWGAVERGTTGWVPLAILFFHLLVSRWVENVVG
ncbi:unnamed protein product [Vitrella brassicaformis CCMP3155]|uniref:Uncharacterized protein n=6 Tax=Vitrella brassicaformis TaxID=1169539 RepID=A0A0G4FFI1_VITBC|nr:unnamed protein product [Vitrella brassicaformis CCMP3155]|eukprot:CEM11927.1 unnamed protein product [Vitrella brassicaformis CCMP3155]